MDGPTGNGGSWITRESALVLALVLLAVTFVAYLPALKAGFIWDDDANLTNHPAIVGPLGFKDIWTSASGFYFPLVTSCFWVQHALWGLNPLPYHLVNILLHAANGLLLWQVLRQLRVSGAWLGAMLWALHPVQVESVAWITELKNTQSGVFYLLTIRFFLCWVTGSAAGRAAAAPSAPGANRHYAIALVCGVAAILSKSSTVMLPVVLGLCWWWTTKDWQWRRIFWLAPFAAVSALASVWTIWEQKVHSGASGAAWSQSFLERLVIAGKDVWFYLGKLAWPHPLIFIYPRWSADASRAASFIPIVAATVALLALWWWRRKAAPVCLAALYFVVSLFPLLGFFNVYFFRYSFVGDHFQYLASMGVLALAGAGVTTAFERWGRARLLPAVAMLLALTLGVLTWRQCGIYRDLVTLYQSIIVRNPSCAMAYYNLGNTFRDQGKTREAMAEYERALQYDPDAADVLTALGVVLGQAGRGGEAVSRFEAALRADPNYAVAHNQLGVVLAKSGHAPEAVAHFETALRIDPQLADAHNNLGNVWRVEGRLPDALAEYEAALRLNPRYVEAHNNLGSALGATEHFPEAVSQFEQSLRIDPNQPETQSNLGLVLMMSEHPQEAIAHFEQALKLNPNLAQAQLNLAMALEAVGRTGEAASHYEAARQLGAAVPPPRS